MPALKKLALTALCLTLAALCSCAASHKTYEKRMASKNVSERIQAAKELRAAPRDPKLVPIILAACRDEDADVREYAFYALGRVDPRIDGVVAAIFVGMEDQNQNVRRAVVNAMREFNPFPNTCIPIMIRLLVDKDDKIREMVVGHFLDMRDVGVSSLLRNVETSRTDEIRGMIIYVLGRMGPEAKNALPRLKRMASSDENKDLRELAEKAVAAIEGGERMPIKMPVIESATKSASAPKKVEDDVQEIGGFSTPGVFSGFGESGDSGLFGESGGSGGSGGSGSSGGSSGSGSSGGSGESGGWLGGFRDFGD
ncbi:MAG: hypothetical protein FWC23_07035 [Chitinispirillia bacterium]|nr:hypothetical protein [Chitinispirillia bacterium]MCL2268923.1 hypothetical protein [Chitinispirillia bacterium]